MTIAQAGQPAPHKPLRLWPGVAAGVLLVLVRFAVPIAVPDATFIGVLGGLFCGLAVVVWWAFFSRAPRWERWGGLVLIIVALAATPRFLHESIRTGSMGATFFLYAIPALGLALVAWAVGCRRLADGPRRASMAAAILVACGMWALLRTEGIHGGDSEFAWRWSQTAEERLLAQAGDEPAALAAAPAAETSQERPRLPDADTAITAQGSGEPASAPARARTPGDQPLAPDVKIAIKARTGDEPAAHHERLAAERSEELASSPAATEIAAGWTGFRGPNRDGIVRGVRIETDWSRSPPVELWRRPVGPGWSSFAVHGNLLYTQEQRGEDEIVACYNLTSGEPVWMHRDAARFWESNAGAGPRATPALGNGRVYSFGATGILNALDARNGAVVWSRNAAADTGVRVPYWGFASSPLVIDDLVIVAAAGQLAAYDLAVGELRWTGPANGDGYSSPHRLTIGGVTQILLLSGAGATSVAPADGTLLWEHSWGGFASLQPALTAGGEVLITSSGATGGLGTRRLAVTKGPGASLGQASSLPSQGGQGSSLPSQVEPGGWTVQERWTSSGLKPYFNDFVVHAGHAYGFDGRILSCIDLEDGQRKWKGGRYGNGQLILLPGQDVLLVLSDEGELALVGATPTEFQQLARFPAIEGKTWNHPVLAGDVLLVRNDREMAAFRLALAGR